MKLDEERVNTDNHALAEADTAAKEYPSDDAVVECPFAKEEEEEKPPLKLMLWRIRGLGGGFHSPSVRPGYIIDAYAETIKSTKADVLILMGLTCTTGWVPKNKNEGGIVGMGEAVQDSGIKEANRILTALGKVDAGGGWKLITVDDDKGKYTYFREQTSCVLFKGGKGISCKDVIVTNCESDFLSVTTMSIPDTFNCPELPLIVPLAVDQKIFSAKTTTPPKVTGEIPASGIFGFSSTKGLQGNTTYRDFRKQCDVEYMPPLAYGSKLNIPYWEEVVERDEALLENYIAINSANVIAQDAIMHWEAITLEKHPSTLQKVIGRLSDSLLVKRGESGLTLSNVRIVDLVRAALDTKVIANLGADDVLDEDSSLAGKCKQETKMAAHTKNMNAEPKVENHIAEAMLFVRGLSDHWPLIADVELA